MANPNKPEWLAVWMEKEEVCLIDQRLLPHERKIIRTQHYQETIAIIRDMAVRGAGTIGVTAGFAMAQAVLKANALEEIQAAARQINAARPTAKNLSYAVERVLKAVEGAKSMPQAQARAVEESQRIHNDDVWMTQRIAESGAILIPESQAVMTHCNAGWLAYAGWGTALAPIYMAHQQGKKVFVIANETRPRSQGAKLTSWELKEAGIPHALIADTAAGYTMKKGEVGLVIVGADRIAANGDTANKIGTYSLSVLAKAHGIPFYVAAPSPTFDPDCPSGEQIPIEERAESEVLEVSGIPVEGNESLTVRIAASGVTAKNPAFDVTPAQNITGFITECGIVTPSGEAIAQFWRQAIQERERPVKREYASR